jgi:hypothetical protein
MLKSINKKKNKIKSVHTYIFIYSIENALKNMQFIDLRYNKKKNQYVTQK